MQTECLYVCLYAPSEDLVCIPHSPHSFNLFLLVPTKHNNHTNNTLATATRSPQQHVGTSSACVAVVSSHKAVCVHPQMNIAALLDCGSNLLRLPGETVSQTLLRLQNL